jgi:hypothetical protein
LNNKFLVSPLIGLILCGPVGARVFNTPLKLKVYARGSGEIPDRVLGFTPSRQGHPVRIPLHELWYVRPIGPLSASTLERLVHVVKKEGIPGLDLSDHWELTNESLSHLRSLTHLVMLDISRTKISDSGLSYLNACRGLVVLMLPDAITDAGLAKLKNLHDLRELNLDETHISDQGLSGLTHLLHLESLDLSSTRTTDAGVALLAKLPQLNRLVLGGAITDAGAASLQKLIHLREIDISQTQIGEQGLGALGSLPDLRTLYVGRQVTDAGLKALSKSPALRAIDLSRTGVTDAGIKQLAKVKTLEEVALSQTAVGNACLPYLAELPELRMLELSDTRVTSAGLIPLARLKKLEVLSLSWQTLSREDLQGMAKLKQLKTIVLNGIPLPEATMAQLKQLGTPSPWDSFAGLQHAQLKETQKMDNGAIGAPVVIVPNSDQSMRLKEPLLLSSSVTAHGESIASSPQPSSQAMAEPKQAPPKMTARPSSQQETLVSLPTRPETIDMSTSPSVSMLPRRTEVGNGIAADRARPSFISAFSLEGRRDVSASPSSAAAPLDITAKKSSEDNLLQTITLQSNPARAGGFGGLSAMRQLHQTENVVAINTLSSGDKATIAQQEDKPENYLGDISVGAAR